jgi:hypothetical protein
MYENSYVYNPLFSFMYEQHRNNNTHFFITFVLYSILRINETHGLAARFNRTVITMARTILLDSSLPKTLCVEAVNCYIY